MIKSFKLFENNSDSNSAKILAQLGDIKSQCFASIQSELKRIKGIYMRGFNTEDLTYDDSEDRDFDGFLELIEHFSKDFYVEHYDTTENHMVIAIDTNGEEILVEWGDDYQTFPITELDVVESVKLLGVLEKMVSYEQIEMRD
jgi:hypothetical protein